MELRGRLGDPKWPMTAPGGPAPAHSTPKMAPSDLPEARGLQEGPLDPPRGRQGGPLGRPEGAKRRPREPKRAPRRPKRGPRGPKWGPKWDLKCEKWQK